MARSLLLLLFFLQACFPLEDVKDCETLGKCVSCKSSQLVLQEPYNHQEMENECWITGFVQQYRCPVEGEDEGMTNTVYRSCYPAKATRTQELSYIESFMIFLCLTVISTILMLMRRRRILNARSFRAVYRT
ncbi:hypothetical protein WA588_000215 [Blastocystis sp. NMH]